jgi:hypothetical protein
LLISDPKFSDSRGAALASLYARARSITPELFDAKGLQAELAVTRAAAEAIMRRLPIMQFEDLRKVYVRRDDVRR